MSVDFPDPDAPKRIIDAFNAAKIDATVIDSNIGGGGGGKQETEAETKARLLAEERLSLTDKIKAAQDKLNKAALIVKVCV